VNEGNGGSADLTRSLERWMLFLLYLILVSGVWDRLYSIARHTDSPFIAACDVLAWALIPVMFWLAWEAGAFRRPKPAELPPLDGTVLYRLYAEDGELLYVGITEHPERRLRHHALKKEWWPEVARQEVRSYQTRADAARAEHAAITRENPRYNVARMSLEAHLRSARAQ
jgi:predicted GIY-YIG superfamily endonuclease